MYVEINTDKITDIFFRDAFRQIIADSALIFRLKIPISIILSQTVLDQWPCWNYLRTTITDEKVTCHLLQYLVALLHYLLRSVLFYCYVCVPKYSDISEGLALDRII